MTMQTSPQGAGFLQSANGQLIVLCAVLAVILVGAWFFVF